MNSVQLWKSRARRGGAKRVGASIAASLVLCVSFAGCSVSQLNKRADALSVSVAPVIDQSAAAYRDTVALHNLRGDYEAVVAYEDKDTSYNPRNVPVLLTEKDIQARLAVLAALQVYSKSLIEITRGTDSPELEAASKSAGSNLASLGNDLAPSVEGVLGIAVSGGSTTTTTVTTVSYSNNTTTSSTTSSAATLLSPQTRNGISTAVDALGQFLVSRKIANELPAKIEAMDPVIQSFCGTLSDDITALDGIEQRDYDRILNLEKQFILEDEQTSKNTNPQAWRAEIMKLPEIARQQQEAHERLDSLREALNKLARAHQALAAEAQHNTPESLKDKLGDLADTGNSLGKFYSALPTK
jgi:hypothetical protein